jgi:predicted nucleotidyltransferase
MHIPADSMKIYQETARRRQAEGSRRLTRRREHAWEVARQAAALLRRQFGAGQVLVFGSLVRSHLFHSRSDVDLAVWGLEERQYYRAVAQVLALDPAVEIDLVRVEEAPASLLVCIEREGVEI